MSRNRRNGSQEAESSNHANKYRSIGQSLRTASRQEQDEEEEEEEEVEDELTGPNPSIHRAFLRALSPPLPSGIDGSKRWENRRQGGDEEEQTQAGKGKGKEKERPLSDPDSAQEKDHDGADLMCRVCWCGDLEEEEGPEGRLIAPCKCSGTSKYIHRSCLKEWRQKGGGRHSRLCLQCSSRYKMKTNPRILFLLWATNNELLRMLITVLLVSSAVLVSGALGALVIPILGSISGYGSVSPTSSIADPRYNISVSPKSNQVQIEFDGEGGISTYSSAAFTSNPEGFEGMKRLFSDPDLEEEARANALNIIEVEMEMEPDWLRQCETSETEGDDDLGEEMLVDSGLNHKLWDLEPQANGSRLFLPQQGEAWLTIFRSLEVFPPTSLSDSLLKLNPSDHQTVYRMNNVLPNDSYSFHDDILKPLWIDWAGLNPSTSNLKASRNLNPCKVPGPHRKAFTIEYIWKPSETFKFPRLFRDDKDEDVRVLEEHPLVELFPESFGWFRYVPISLWLVFIKSINSYLPELIDATTRAAAQLYWLVISREALEEIAWASAQIMLHGIAAFLIEYQALPGLKHRNPTLQKMTNFGSRSCLFLLDQIFGSGRGLGGYPLSVYRHKNKTILPADLLVFYSIFAPRFILPTQYLLGFLLWLLTWVNAFEPKVSSALETVKKWQSSDWNTLDQSATVGYSRMLNGLVGGTGSEARPYDLFQHYNKEPVEIPGKVRPFDLARLSDRQSWRDFFFLSIYLGSLFIVAASYWPALRWTYRHGLRHVIQEGRNHLFKLLGLLRTYFRTISRASKSLWNRISNRRIERDHQPPREAAENREHLPGLGSQLTDISSALGWLYVTSSYVFRALQQVTWWLCIVPHMTVSDWIENYLSSIVIAQEVIDGSGR